MLEGFRLCKACCGSSLLCDQEHRSQSKPKFLHILLFVQGFDSHRRPIPCSTGDIFSYGFKPLQPNELCILGSQLIRPFMNTAAMTNRQIALKKELRSLRALLDSSEGQAEGIAAHSLSISESELRAFPTIEETLRRTRTLRSRAQAPYSAFKVAALALSSDGTMTPGVNVECSSYGGTICAERSALVSAISHGHRDFVFFTVYAATKEAIAPCGLCRQLLHDYAEDAMILMMSKGKQHTLSTIGELLPGAFGAHALRETR